MKYAIVLCDGMADYPVEALGGRTPMECAKKPNMDRLASEGEVGLVRTVADGMKPGSDVANLSVMGYNPLDCYTGRSPLEAVSMGIEMQPDETAYRCNVVTLTEDEENYEDRIILDHSADEITTAEADQLVKTLQEKMGDEIKTFYTGVSYRHCLIWKNGNDTYNFMRPHDILGKRIGEYLPRVEDGGKDFLELMKKSYDILKDHPVNLDRKARGLKPANSAWLWSPGKKPQLPSFKEKWGLDATVISAVDLIKGIGLCAGMQSVDVEGATGNVHTNYDGKANAAIEAFQNGADYVYIHVEAPDECGHRAELENKVLSVELIDQKILKPVYEYLEGCGESFKIMVLPDHPTPIRLRTHTIDPVPFFIYSSEKQENGVSSFDEFHAAETGLYVKDGFTLMNRFMEA